MIFNHFEDVPVFEEEDYTKEVLTVKGGTEKWTETECVDQPIKQSKEHHELLYIWNQTRKRRWITPGIQEDDGHTSLVRCIHTQNRKIIFHSCISKYNISTQYTSTL